MNILLLSTGGGGGNILRSLKALFDLDVAVTRQTDPDYADRLRASLTARFLDTNEFSLIDLPAEERFLIGTRTTGRLGARHNPDVAAQALDESKGEVEAVLHNHSVIILIGTGGKGTGAGTIFPLARMARRLKKLVLPIFVRPSFERHEVDKRRYDHALKVGEEFDAAGIRLIEILNDRGYDEASPKPQRVVWERMNLPIARGLRGLIYVLWDLCQVDPSDLSMLFAGPGRLRIGFGEMDSPFGTDPRDEQIEQAVRSCWDNPYYAFGRPVGTSLVCIHGEWSNVVDAKIKGSLAGAAMGGTAGSPYTPLYTRAVQSPRPWGVTALFGEYSGAHSPLEIDWSFERRDLPVSRPTARTTETSVATAAVPVEVTPTLAATEAPPASSVEDDSPLPSIAPVQPAPRPAAPKPRSGEHGPAAPKLRSGEGGTSGLWELAVAMNRGEAAALALAGNGGAADVAIEGGEVRKLLGTMWFRALVPRFSQQWQARILDALVDGVAVPDHGMRIGRKTIPLSELDYDQLQQVAAKSWVPDAARADLELLVAVGRLWGGEALKRLRFAAAPAQNESAFARFLASYRR